MDVYLPYALRLLQLRGYGMALPRETNEYGLMDLSPSTLPKALSSNRKNVCTWSVVRTVGLWAAAGTRCLMALSIHFRSTVPKLTPRFLVCLSDANLVLVWYVSHIKIHIGAIRFCRGSWNPRSPGHGCRTCILEKSPVPKWWIFSGFETAT